MSRGGLGGHLGERTRGRLGVKECLGVQGVTGGPGQGKTREIVTMTAYTTEGLPGRITVWAPHLKPLLNLVPPSHNGCVRGFTLVPTEECIFPKHIFREVSVLPAWCTITKCGHYKGDLEDIISFNAQT